MSNLHALLEQSQVEGSQEVVEQNRNAFLVVIDSIAYFLAGTFTIDKAVVESSDASSWHINNWVTLVVGVILVAAGFAYLLSILPFLNRPFGFMRKLPTKLQTFLTALVACFLLTITLTHVVIEAFNHARMPGPPLWTVYLAFVALLIVAFVYASRKVFSTTEGVIYMTIGLSVLAVFILLTEDFSNEKVTIFSVSLSEGSLQLSFIGVLLAFLLLVFTVSSREASLERR